MIISHKHQFVFCKSRKTAGSSIQIALSRQCGENDLIVGSVENDGVVDESNTAGRIRDQAGRLDHPHTPLNDIYSVVNPDYFMFTWVRNPFDLIVSRYHWDLSKAGRSSDASIDGFREWIKSIYCHPLGTYLQDVQYRYYSVGDDGSIDVDFIGRYETLQDDYDRLCDELGLERSELGWHKKSNGRQHYSLYYDDESRALVERYFDTDLRVLGYEFEPLKIYSKTGNRVRVIDRKTINEDNVNGVSVVKNEGGYRVYFANHRGKYIRLMCGARLDKLRWAKLGLGVLHLDDTPCKTHIASPDVHLDQDGQWEMFYHGDTDDGQHTFYATSPDGFNFESLDEPIAHFYFRRFGKYAVAKKNNKCGVIYENVEGIWVEKFELIPNMRHAYPQVDGNILSLFYTRVGDSPEHIRICVINLGNWEVINDYELIRAQEDWEGAVYDSRPSSFGAVQDRCNELRDPFVLTDGDKKYLFYIYAGETGIAYTELL